MGLLCDPGSELLLLMRWEEEKRREGRDHTEEEINRTEEDKSK